MNVTCTKRLEFDFGHRLLNHESKCAHVHGHRGMLDITCSSPAGLDHAGRIIDFGDIKRLVGGWIDDHIDHAFVYNAEDLVMREFLRTHKQRCHELPCEPSAENLARMLGHRAATILFVRDIVVTHVRFYETPTSWADWVP